MKKPLGILLVILAILIAITRFSALSGAADKADAISKMIPEFILCAGLGIWGLYLAGVIKGNK